MKSQATSSHGGPFVLELLVDFSNWPFGPLVFSSSHSYVSKSPMRSEPTATLGPSLDPRKSRTQAPALCTLDPRPSCVVVLGDVQVLWVTNLYFIFHFLMVTAEWCLAIVRTTRVGPTTWCLTGWHPHRTRVKARDRSKVSNWGPGHAVGYRHSLC